MAQCCHLIKAAFPKINDDIYQVSPNTCTSTTCQEVHLDFKEKMDIGDVSFIWQYVESVLETSGDDFESTDDLYEAIGEVSFPRKKSKQNLI